MENELKSYSSFLASKAFNEAETFPVDRYFLEPHIEHIKSFNRNDFLIQNLNDESSLYVVYLFLCLPELWEDIERKDLEFIIQKLQSEYSLFTLILFTYKFVEIDIIEWVFELNAVSDIIKKGVVAYLENQYINFLKTETDYFFFDIGIYGVKNEVWMYVKQKLLLDKKIKPALTSTIEIKEYLYAILPRLGANGPTN